MKDILGIRLYTLAEVGELLGIQTQTASKYVQEGKLQARTIGGHKYVSEEHLKAFLLSGDRRKQ